ncbi:MAG: hypothetical protein M0Z66_01160 [Thermaerobacter sp.]|nr:hypothetical protein [Thermaerobacter sp.]
MRSPLVGCTLEEAEAVCRRDGFTLLITTTRPPRAFAGDELRVVRVRQKEKVMEVLVASFQAAQDPQP